MKPLAMTLKFKIALTVLFWCVPLLFFPESLYLQLGFVDIGSFVFLKLLGVAYVALVAGYYLGYQDLIRGYYPSNTVIVGIVSNFGACIMLIMLAFSNAWSEWGVLAQLYMWASLAATGLISLFLFVFGVKRYGATYRLVSD